MNSVDENMPLSHTIIKQFKFVLENESKVISHSKRGRNYNELMLCMYVDRKVSILFNVEVIQLKA